MGDEKNQMLQDIYSSHCAKKIQRVPEYARRGKEKRS